MNLRERATEIKGIFYSSCKDIIDEPPSFEIIPDIKYADYGTIFEEGIRFIDGSFLNFLEEIKKGDIGRYGYEYVRPDTGFFFHYQNEGIENGIRKPLNHLHVGILKKYANGNLLDLLPDELKEHKGPHFKAPEIKFNEFMGMIIVSFFADHRSCEDIIRSLGV